MNMKRRNRTSPNGTRIHNCTDGQIRRFSCPSIKDLPREVFVNILLKLPMQSIISCKRICKSLAHSGFRTLNLLRRTWRSNTSLFIQDNGYLYLMEQPEDEFSSCECGSVIRINLDSELNIPLCNTQVMFSGQHHEDHNFPNMRCQNYKIANSCYGLVCLAGIWDEPLVISNPVLGDFLNLLRRFISQLEKNKVDISTRVCGHLGTWGEILAIGTGSLWLCSPWKSVGSAPKTNPNSDHPTYFHGRLHWLSSAVSSIPYFDFDNEKFDFLSLPKDNIIRQTQVGMTIDVVDGCLCLMPFL
ncbi:hypothetical protein TIFTF001_045157 [Ficus carica]|uniref:F-box domain-containing protein n=1 Tax=Ficus carica TaxID=3494 RepID=A0AA87YP82_FICCA|nr:hypothetical protein TIFTF001_045156 [Ficus carica]GMN19267.1 hypothetical protein TIFTF001_045157 [Ficus carica]